MMQNYCDWRIDLLGGFRPNRGSNDFAIHTKAVCEGHVAMRNKEILL